MKNLMAVTLVGLSLAGCGSLQPGMSERGMSDRGMSENNAGARALNKDQFTQAEALFKKSLEANPNNAYALTNLGHLYRRTGRLNEAKAMYQRVVDLHTREVPTVTLGANSMKSAVDAKPDSLQTTAQNYLDALNLNVRTNTAGVQ